MRNQMQVLLLLFAGLALSLTGAIFFGVRPFYWAGEQVGAATQPIIGAAFIVAGLFGAFKAGKFSRLT